MTQQQLPAQLVVEGEGLGLRLLDADRPVQAGDRGLHVEEIAIVDTGLRAAGRLGRRGSRGDRDLALLVRIAVRDQHTVGGVQ